MTTPGVLLVCTKFGRSPHDRYLTNELADALAATGRRVFVVAIDWAATPGGHDQVLTQANGVEALIVAPWQVRGLGRLVALGSKWIGSSWLAAGKARRWLQHRRFDQLVAFTPVVAQAFVVLWAMRRRSCASYLIAFDFFPFHQRSLGLMPGGPILRIARWAETTLYRRFDVIGCMTPRGIDFLEQNFGLSPGQRGEVIYLWGPREPGGEIDRASVREAFDLPRNSPIAVFGGQIVEGRGIEGLLDTARLAREARPDLSFLFVGAGRLEWLVRARIAEGADNVILIEQIARDRYLQLISACDVGIVATVADVDVPTFPSKTIDYLRAGLPVAASVEASTDYSDFVQERGFGVAVEAGEPARLLDAILRILDSPERSASMRAAGRRTLIEVFDVAHTARRILDLASNRPT
jgi:glycosyltransferase involved in cell wall biosynthesis